MQSTHLIGDAGLNPHPPSRLIFKGAPRTTLVRHLKPSVSLPAVLPHGPQREQKHSFDALVELNNTMEQNYATFAVRTTSILRGLIWDAEEGQHEKKTEWSQGPKFIWKNVASPPATDKARSTPVSRAWKNTTSWLHVVKANRSTHLVKVAQWKLLHYEHPLRVDDPAMQQDAAAFLAWKKCLSQHNLSTPGWVASFLEVATKAAAQADAEASGQQEADPTRKRPIPWREACSQHGRSYRN